MIDYMIHAPDRATFVAVMAALAHPADGVPAGMQGASGVRIIEPGTVATPARMWA